LPEGAATPAQGIWEGMDVRAASGSARLIESSELWRNPFEWGRSLHLSQIERTPPYLKMYLACFLPFSLKFSRYLKKKSYRLVALKKQERTN